MRFNLDFWFLRIFVFVLFSTWPRILTGKHCTNILHFTYVIFICVHYSSRHFSPHPLYSATHKQSSWSLFRLFVLNSLSDEGQHITYPYWDEQTELPEFHWITLSRRSFWLFILYSLFEKCVIGRWERGKLVYHTWFGQRSLDGVRDCLRCC